MMLGRGAILLLALALLAGLQATAMAQGQGEIVLKRDDEYSEVAVQEDDDFDGDTGNTGNTGNTGDTSGVDSNDGTGSGHSAVSRDRDRSRGDKTRDWTRDGGDRTRDNTQNHTNDGSRNDTR